MKFYIICYWGASGEVFVDKLNHRGNDMGKVYKEIDQFYQDNNNIVICLEEKSFLSLRKQIDGLLKKNKMVIKMNRAGK